MRACPAAALALFLTGTTVEVLPVTQVDEQPVGAGKPGALTRRLQELFRATVA